MARAATHRWLGPRLIERIVHVRAGGFAVPFPALPKARGRHAWGATPPPLRNARRRHGPCGHAPASYRSRLIERRKRVRAASFAGTFPALPKARGRHAWGATPRPCGTQEGGMARAATHRRRAAGAYPTAPRCFLSRKRGNALITARAPLAPVPRREGAGAAPKFSCKKAWHGNEDC